MLAFMVVQPEISELLTARGVWIEGYIQDQGTNRGLDNSECQKTHRIDVFKCMEQERWTRTINFSCQL